MDEEQAVVLVVDDNEINRDVLSRRLTRYGCQAEAVDNGRDALRKIQEKDYDLVLLDIMMPEMNGYQVLERLKADPITRDLPVIVISALDDIESIVKCIQLGAEDYLPKPFNPLLLKARVGASLDKKRLRDREQEYLEEQVVSQRIDRELNAQLDMKSIARITLDWAKRRSQADMLLIGVVRQHAGLQIVDSYGLGEIQDYYVDGFLPIDPPPIKRAMETILPQSSTDPNDFVRHDTQKQIVMPLGRTGQVIAVLVLESCDPHLFTNPLLAFLTRLSDRAAVALANAQLYEAVQEANAAKSEFVGEVSHELNNPLTSILNYAKMIGGMGEINEMQTHFLNTIISNANRMARLVNDLREISRLEAGHLQLQSTAVNVREVIDDVIDSFDGQIRDKQQELVINVDDALPPAWCDQTRTTQVLTNLVSNAHKYTPEGGTLTIHTVIVEADAVIQISIEDTGIGLRPEDQSKIFQKYFRAADEKAQASPGTGLGLNITKRLVELQGGQIWFESAFRQGTTFHFTIPIAKS